MKMSCYRFCCVIALLVLSLPLNATAAEEKEENPNAISLSDGKITMVAPEGWQRKQPRVRIIEAEFAVPAVGDDENDGRITVMGAGGSVKANIDRWIGQFVQTDRNEVKKKEIAGQEVHIVDLSGTFKDQRGPFAPATIRKDYRMLGAIIVTENAGQYFAKLYGPKKTIEANVDKFEELLKSLKVK